MIGGKDMLTNEQLIDSLIVDCNNAVKELTNGQYLAWCAIMTSMTQKLANLKKTISNDLKNRDETIEILKNELRNAGQTVTDYKPEEIDQILTQKEKKEEGDNNGKD